MKLLTLARDLKRRKARERQSRFVAEGVRAVEELLRSPLIITGALAISDGPADTRRGAILQSLEKRGVPVEQVGEAEFASAAETDTPQGILAIADIPSDSMETLERPESLRLIVLDGVQDPGNVGTIVRTAAALGASGVVALPGTVDLWNAKVVRSGMGAHFNLPAITASHDEFSSFLDRSGVVLWGADAAGEQLDAEAAPDRLALVVGNEGGGLSTFTRERVETLVALPISSAVESLNVAVATGIFLYLLRR